jgi:DNA-binding MurR/RpiR family transcriptional regulator
MIRSCLLEIQNRYEELTPVEKCVADYIHENGRQVVHMSVRELADQAGVAKSAVLRCCKALGFSGFPDLKISLSADLAKNQEMKFSSHISHNDDIENILDKVFSSNVKALHDTREQLNSNMIEQLVDAMEKASAVYIYGVGVSAPFCSDFQFRLFQIGKRAYFMTDSYSMKMSTMDIKEGDVAIGISHYGQTVMVLDALKLAKERGAVTSCITGHSESLIAKECDLPIIIAAEEMKYPIDTISTRIAVISIMDAITIALSTRSFDNALDRYQYFRELENTLRY